MGSMHDSSISLDLSIGTFQVCNNPLIQKYHHENTNKEQDEVILNSMVKADIEEEMKHAVEENRRLTAMLSAVCERHRALRAQVLGLISSPAASSLWTTLPPMKRMRKSGGAKQIDQAGNGSCKENVSGYGSNCRQTVEEARPRVSKLYIRADGLVVRDGYHWRKYGQKVIRDNRYPRAYFRCSFAPICPVKKKVQRCTEDHSVLVVTYEGEHNHVQPSPSDPLKGLS